jgi:hypothetical protein
MRSTAARLVLLLTAIACAGDEPRTRTLENTGDVIIDRCGGWCDDVEASCNASLVSGAILVTSKAVATSPATGTDCPDACAPVWTECVLPELPAGNYQLHHGTGSGSVTLPVTARTQVTGSPYPSPPS